MRRCPVAILLVLTMEINDGGQSAYANGWQENFAFEKVALLNRIDNYRQCVAVAPFREVMLECRY